MRNIPYAYTQRERERIQCACIGIDQVPWPVEIVSVIQEIPPVLRDNPTKLENGFVFTSRGFKLRYAFAARNTCRTLGILGGSLSRGPGAKSSQHNARETIIRDTSPQRPPPPVNSLKVSRHGS